jgi:hypothetical protein
MWARASHSCKGQHERELFFRLDTGAGPIRLRTQLQGLAGSLLGTFGVNFLMRNS